MEQLYKKFEFSTVQELTGVSSYYEPAGMPGGVTSHYVEPKPLPVDTSQYDEAETLPVDTSQYDEADELPMPNYEIPDDLVNAHVQAAINLGEETSPPPTSPPPTSPPSTSPPSTASRPKLNFSSFDEELKKNKKNIIDNIDSDVYPSHFSVAGVYEEGLGGEYTDAVKADVVTRLNEFITKFPQVLQNNDYFKLFKENVIQKVIENIHKVKDKVIILQNTNTLGTDFLTKFKETQSLVSFAKVVAEKISSTEQTYADLFNKYNSIIKASDKLFECFILLREERIKAIREPDIGASLFILFFMTVIHNIYVGGLKKYFRKSLTKFIRRVEEATGTVRTRGGGEEEEDKSSKLELNLDSNVIRMLKEYVSVYTELDSDNKELAGNFTNIIPILISRSMKGGFISPFIRNFKNAFKRSSESNRGPNSFNLVNHIFFIKKDKRPFKYDEQSNPQPEQSSESAMTTYTFGSNLQNTFDITSLGVIKTGKIIGKITPLPKKSLSNSYFIEAPNNSNIKTRILGSNYTKQTIKTSENFVELLEIQLEDIKKKGIVANFHSALETSNDLMVGDLHSYSYKLYSEQDLADAVPDTSLYAQTQIVSELFNALKHSVVNK